MNSDVLTELLLVSQSDRYPDGFLNDYEPLECLAHREGCETLLVKNKQTGVHYVAKCYATDTDVSRASEADILKKLEYPGLPRFTAEYRNDGLHCVVREYVEGLPLNRYVEINKPSAARAVALTVELCDILTYLHGQTPPVIHRDIKPQNIVVDAAGKLWLIDFGISRLYDSHTETDTTCMGTRHFAAPEQYGYSQTDNRADIFSLGVLLGWLLTGETKHNVICAKIADRQTRHIVERCTAFAPDERYPSAEKVRAELLRLGGQRRKRALFAACAAVACVVCLCAGFWVGRYTDFTVGGSSGVAFQEPLVAQAVRMQLGLGENEPIAENDLLKVTEINLYGDQVAVDYAAFDEINQHMALNDGTAKNGGIVSLADMVKLKNLTILRIVLENITDLSPLSTLAGLEVLDLRHNPIESISPLETLTRLNALCLYGTRVSDLTPLSACAMLKSLDVGKTNITSFTAFRELGNLRYLNVRGAPVVELDGLQNLTRLETLGLNEITEADVQTLCKLEKLKEVSPDTAPDTQTISALEQAGLTVHLP
jgi:hypothetical protein